MINKEKLGEFEIIKTDKSLVKIANRIMDLNEKILEQNKILVEAITFSLQPLIIKNPDLDENKH